MLLSFTKLFISSNYVTHRPLTAIHFSSSFDQKMANNIRFHYLYRDSGNYKTFGFVDFSNPNNLSLEEIQAQITAKLISEEFFYPVESGIEKFEFHRYCDDYAWYEFDGLEMVSGQIPEKSVEEFIANISTKLDFK